MIITERRGRRRRFWRLFVNQCSERAVRLEIALMLINFNDIYPSAIMGKVFSSLRVSDKHNQTIGAALLLFLTFASQRKHKLRAYTCKYPLFSNNGRTRQK